MWWYLAVMNTLGFALMGLDKKRAGEHQWRISERTLFLVAALGGSVGSWLGMYIFHHKTRKAKFYLGIPLILVIQCALTFILER